LFLWPALYASTRLWVKACVGDRVHMVIVVPSSADPVSPADDPDGAL
jgi:hypothetical protein